MLGVLGAGLALTIGLEPTQLAVIVVPLGIGVVLGVLGLRRFGDRLPRRRAAEGGLVTFGILTASLSLAGVLSGWLAGLGLSVLPFVVAAAVGAGAAYAVVSVSAQTALLESMPSEVRGRVFGVLASIVSAASLVPTLIAGPLADRVSAPLVIGVVGLAVVGVGLLSAWRFGPRERPSVGPATVGACPTTSRRCRTRRPCCSTSTARSSTRSRRASRPGSWRSRTPAYRPRTSASPR